MPDRVEGCCGSRKKERVGFCRCLDGPAWPDQTCTRIGHATARRCTRSPDSPEPERDICRSTEESIRETCETNWETHAAGQWLVHLSVQLHDKKFSSHPPASCDRSHATHLAPQRPSSASLQRPHLLPIPSKAMPFVPICESFFDLLLNSLGV